MSERPLLSIVTPCFNEEDNVDELYTRIKAAIADLTKYEFELIFIDNYSQDGTVAKLKSLIVAGDAPIQVITNVIATDPAITALVIGQANASGHRTVSLADAIAGR